ncbi:F-type H+-transporting ATPase subunit epsilon [Ruminococcaceae bacterium FB2012]|nr:F-type H+-transporting ATPase subunit epsilon [Ruminococcaceae bacterium FB2012]
MNTFKLKIITPEKVFYEGDAVQIIAKTAAGNVGIMAGHTPYVANIVPSPLRISENGTDFRVAAVSAGVVKFENGAATVVTTAVEWAEDIDIARAERSKERAERELAAEASDKEFRHAEQRLKRALNRLTVSGKK